MTTRPAKRPLSEGLHLHLVSGETIRLRRFESLRIMAHPYMLGFYVLFWLALVIADPSGSTESTPYSIRFAQYGAGVSTVVLTFLATLGGSELLFGGKGRPVRLSDWPIVLVACAIGLAAGEAVAFLLTDTLRMSVKIFAILTVFYFVLTELGLQLIVWLFLPRILATLRRDAPARATIPADGTMLRAGGLALAPATLLHLSAQGNYVTITADTASHEVPGPFSALLDQLPPGLGLRVHRSHWVARRAITGHHRKGREMLLDLANGTQIPVALPRHAEVLDWLATPSPDA